MKSFIWIALLYSFFALPQTWCASILPMDSNESSRGRSIAAKEAQADEPELLDAWNLYRSFQGCWLPNAPKPDHAKLARLDSLILNLERQDTPAWIKDFNAGGHIIAVKIAANVTDPAFLAQSATREYQIQKALAICYMAKHELDAPDAADKAGKLLTVLVATHPWDWEVHGLYARLLVDAQQCDAALHEVGYSLCLNPAPSKEDIEFFIFVAFACKAQLGSVKEAIASIVSDKQLQGKMIKQAEEAMSKAKRQFVPAKE